MPIKTFNERSTPRLLDFSSTDVLGNQRDRTHRHLPRHNRMSHHSKCRHQGLDHDDDDDGTYGEHPHDEKSMKCDMNGNIYRDRHQDEEEEEYEHHKFHFHPNPMMHCFPPPPAYQSRPATPTGKASAPPLAEMEGVCRTSGMHVSTADHFQRIYGCRTTTNIIVLVTGVILFVVFLILLILLA